jgi:hypothetical protein
MAQSQPRVSGRKEGHCPICGDEYEDSTRLTERIEHGESEDVPGVVYDHNGDGTCFEWADGYTEQN